jgi:hypothetical protein
MLGMTHDMYKCEACENELYVKDDGNVKSV